MKMTDKQVEDLSEESGEASDLEFGSEDGSESIDPEEIKKFVTELNFPQLFSGKTIDKRNNKDNSDIPVSLPITKSTEVKKDVRRESSQKSAAYSNKDQQQAKKGQDHLKLKFGHKLRKYLLVKPGMKWHEIDTITASNRKISDTVSPVLLKAYESFAEQLLEEEVSFYEKNEKNKSNQAQWMKTVVSKGTLTDRMAALTLLIQDSPVQSLSYLDVLVNMSKKKEKRESLTAITTLKDLFVSELLPDARKLRTFDEQQLSLLHSQFSNNVLTRDRTLLLWIYESKLKKKYSEFVFNLQSLLFDNLRAVKFKTLKIVFELLTKKPEQEKILLGLITNKLGDPDHKVAARATNLLTQLVGNHPNMKGVIIEDVERMIFRPNIADKAQYYGICFMNQLVLSQDEDHLASKLISIYFSFFKSLVKKGEVHSKMLSALLTGVNRAFPFTKKDGVLISEKMDTLYKIVHTTNFNVSVQALMLLFQVLDAKQSITDRFYIALYKKLEDPELKLSSKHSLFLSLLFKSLHKDVAYHRVKAFLKKLLQICALQPPNFICGILLLIGELVKERHGLLCFQREFNEYDQMDEEKFEDVEDDASENHNYKNGSEIHLHQNADTLTSKLDESGKDLLLSNMTANKTGFTETTKPSWIHKRNISGAAFDLNDYDYSQRNPLYAGGEYACLWELQNLAHHFHPSVRVFAEKLLCGEQLAYSGDPLSDFTVVRFLDRFVFRNPKKQFKLDTADMREKIRYKKERYTPKGMKKVAANAPEYIARGASQIPVDEAYLFKYFQRRAELKRKFPAVDDGDTESISDSEFDELLEKYEQDKKDEHLLDFAGDFGREKPSGNSKKTAKKDEDDESIHDNDEGDEVNFGENFMEEFYDSDLEGKEVLDQYSEGGRNFLEGGLAYQGKEDKYENAKRVKSHKKNLDEAAQMFTQMIDETASSKFDMETSEAIANSDKASVKQIRWEDQRHQWLEGRDWKSKKRRKGKDVQKQKHANKKAKTRPKNKRFPPNKKGLIKKR